MNVLNLIISNSVSFEVKPKNGGNHTEWLSEGNLIETLENLGFENYETKSFDRTKTYKSINIFHNNKLFIMKDKDNRWTACNMETGEMI